MSRLGAVIGSGIEPNRSVYWFIGAGRGWLQQECSGQKGFEEHLVTQTDRPLREVGIGADEVAEIIGNS